MCYRSSALGLDTLQRLRSKVAHGTYCEQCHILAIVQLASSANGDSLKGLATPRCAHTATTRIADSVW